MFDQLVADTVGASGALAVDRWTRVESAACARRLAAMVSMLEDAYAAAGSASREQWCIDNWAAVCAHIGACQRITSGAASTLLLIAVALRDRYPKVAALFAAGLIGYPLVRMIVTRAALVKDPDALAALDTALADALTTWEPLSVDKTEHALDAFIAAIDPDAVRRTQTAARGRCVEVAFEDGTGTATLFGSLFATDADAFHHRLNAFADTVCPHDPRTRDQRRADAVGPLSRGEDRLTCLCDTKNCPAPALPPSTGVVVYLIAPADTLTAPTAPTTPTTPPAPEPPAPGLPDAPTPHTDTADYPESDAADAQCDNGSESNPDDDDDDGVGDPGSDAVDAQSDDGSEFDADDDCNGAQESGAAGANADGSESDESEAEAEECAGLDGEAPPMFTKPLREVTWAEVTAPRPGHLSTIPPAVMMGGRFLPGAIARRLTLNAKIIAIIHPGAAPPEPRYRPSKKLADFVRCRDLTCRFPGCKEPATNCDVDHTIAWPCGATQASNLKSLCRKHHLLKTFWAGEDGWHDQQLPDGTVVWTAPDGRTHTTTPGSRLLFPSLSAPTAPVVTTGTPTAHTHGLTMPRRPRTRAQDRAARIDAERELNRIHNAQQPEPRAEPEPAEAPAETTDTRYTLPTDDTDISDCPF